MPTQGELTKTCLVCRQRIKNSTQVRVKLRIPGRREVLMMGYRHAKCNRRTLMADLEQQVLKHEAGNRS